MPKENPYLIKLPETAAVSYFDEAEWNKNLSVEELKQQELIKASYEVEYQDRVLHGPQYGPGNEQSRAVAGAAVAVTAGVVVVGGVVIAASGGAAAPAVATLGSGIVADAYHVHHTHRLQTQHLATLGLLGAMGVLANRPGNRDSERGSSSQRKTIWDWWGNGLEGWQRDYLLKIGYSDSGSVYVLAELKNSAKYCEKELLTEQSQVYIQRWINENGYSSEEERRRGDRVVNCSKKDSPVWKGLKHHGRDHYGREIRTNTKTGSDKRYYQWDNTHNDIEVYNHRGEHLGSMDPRNGNMYKGPKAYTLNI